MCSMPRPLIAGNWKMNLNAGESVSLAAGIGSSPSMDVLICPAFPYISECALAKSAPVLIGAQDCSPHGNGAHTGDISASMLADLKCNMVIVGHSERRQDHAEQGGLVKAKMMAAHNAGLKTILCVGETLVERESGNATAIVKQQLDDSVFSACHASNMAVAYEPVWAIGTGKTASADDIEQMHAFIRQYLIETLADGEQISILYGGSVKPTNASEILSIAHVNGALIGGASLKADDFNAIIQAAADIY